MEVGHATTDYHGTNTSDFFHLRQWHHSVWGGKKEDESWKNLKKSTLSIKPVLRGVIPEHYDKIRTSITKPWPENKVYKSYETRRDFYAGNEIIYCSNA